MNNNKSKATLALVLSIVGFLSGWIAIGVILDIIAIVLVLKPIFKQGKFNIKEFPKQISNIEKRGKYALAIASIGFVLTIMFYSSLGNSNTDENENIVTTQAEEVVEIEKTLNENSNESETNENENESSKSELNEDESDQDESGQATLNQSASSEDTSIIDEEENEALVNEEEANITTSNTYEYDGVVYNIIDVDGGDKSGSRQSNVAVDVGFGDRVYWGLTNEYGQLVYVIASEIILQDDDTEPVNENGRYYDDEAYVPGVEASNLDQGHVIADSLGGTSNAYNITPQDSTLNRYGDQAYMEKAVRDAGGCTDFVATITYSDTDTQIPSHYHFEYKLMGNLIVEDFDNENPEKEEVVTDPKATEEVEPVVEVTPTPEPEPVVEVIEEAPAFDEASELSKIDTNGNGTVTIAEAKAAGFAMPIQSTHWLYKYMIDRDGDGMVGE